MCMTCPDGLREPAVGARGSLLVCAAGAAGAVDGHARHATPRRPQAGRRDGLTAPSLTRRLFWCRSALKVLSWWCGASARCPELLELAIQAPGCAAPSGRAAEPLREPSGRLRCGCAARPKSRRFPRGLRTRRHRRAGVGRVGTRGGEPAAPRLLADLGARVGHAACREFEPEPSWQGRSQVLEPHPERERQGAPSWQGHSAHHGVPGRAKCKCGCAHIRT